MKYIFFALSMIAIVSSCDTSKMAETPDSQFIGTWQLSNKGIFDGIEIEISKDQKGKFTGVVKKLNDNKYVQMFMENGDKFVSDIKRSSNFEFILSEMKIAAPLFSTYGQSTTSDFKATFDGKDKIMLGTNGSDGAYLKIK